MSLEDEIKKGTKKTIEQTTGKPIEALRQATTNLQQPLDDFVQRVLSRPQTQLHVPDTTVRHTTTIIPSAPIATSDSPPAPPATQQASGGTLTARYVDVSSGTPTTATGTFSTP